MADADNDAAEFNEMMSDLAKKMHDQLSDEEKSGPFGKALNYILTARCIGRGLWRSYKPTESFRRGKEALDSMLQLINTGKDKQRFHNALQYHENNVTTIGKLDYEAYFGCPAEQMSCKITQCQDTVSLQSNFQNTIRAAQQEMANKVIRSSARASSVTIILQVVNLHFIWKEISVAKNLHNDPTKFRQIDANIVTLGTIIEQITQAIQANQTNQVSRFTRRAHAKYDQTKTLVNSLYLKINKSFQRLDMSADGQVLDGISYLALAFTNAVQLYELYHLASPSANLVATGMTAAFTMLTVANLATYCITKKRLTELQQDMRDLDSLSQKLDELYETIEQAENSIQE